MSTGTISIYCAIPSESIYFLKKCFMFIYLVWGGVCVRHTIGIEVWGQFSGVCSFLLPCGFWGSDSGHQAWWQVPLPTEKSHWAQINSFQKCIPKKILVPITMYDAESPAFGNMAAKCHWPPWKHIEQPQQPMSSVLQCHWEYKDGLVRLLHGVCRLVNKA